MAVPTLNEGSRCFVTAKFSDLNDVPQIPTSVQYRVDCETTGQALLDWTFVTPDVKVQIQIDATLNTIVNRSNAIERKVVTIQANADPPEDAFVEVQKYDLVNLQGI